jgi:CRP-like cAMP-binding protein
MSSTIIDTTVGILTAGMWLGEESVIMNLPCNFTAKAKSSTVRVFEISKKDFFDKFPIDIQRYM